MTLLCAKLHSTTQKGKLSHWQLPTNFQNAKLHIYTNAGQNSVRQNDVLYLTLLKCKLIQLRKPVRQTH